MNLPLGNNSKKKVRRPNAIKEEASSKIGNKMSEPAKDNKEGERFGIPYIKKRGN